MQTSAELLTLSMNSLDPLLAYIGPGLGGGVIAVILGFIASVFLAIFAIFWYPIKRMLGIKSKPKPKKQKPAETPAAKEAATEAPQGEQQPSSESVASAEGDTPTDTTDKPAEK